MWRKSMLGNSGFSGRNDFAKDFHGLFKNVRECVRGKAVKKYEL